MSEWQAGEALQPTAPGKRPKAQQRQGLLFMRAAIALAFRHHEVSSFRRLSHTNRNSNYPFCRILYIFLGQLVTIRAGISSAVLKILQTGENTDFVCQIAHNRRFCLPRETIPPRKKPLRGALESTIEACTIYGTPEHKTTPRAPFLARPEGVKKGGELTRNLKVPVTCHHSEALSE